MEIPGVTETTVGFLREKIITGELPPNRRLSEPEIANQFNISRSPLREAFRTLEQDKLIVSIPRKGSYVAELSNKDFIELYQSREMIEAYSIDLLREMGLQKLPEVERVLSETKNLKKPDQNDSNREKLNYLFKTVAFHSTLVKSTGNTRLIHFFKILGFHLARYQFQSASKPGVLHRAQEEHDQIYSFLKDAQWEKAKELLLSHIRFNRNLSKQMISKLSEMGRTDLVSTG